MIKKFREYNEGSRSFTTKPKFVDSPLDLGDMGVVDSDGYNWPDHHATGFEEEHAKKIIADAILFSDGNYPDVASSWLKLQSDWLDTGHAYDDYHIGQSVLDSVRHLLEMMLTQANNTPDLEDPEGEDDDWMPSRK